MIIFLTIVCIILTAGLIYCMRHIVLINNELEALGKEQHTQNMDIIRVMKELAKTQNFLLEQFKVNEEVAKAIQYLADKDLIKDIQNMDPNKVGKA